MSSGSYVIRRGRTFSFRIRLPPDLAAHAGRDDYVRALRTDQPAVARFLAAGLGVRLTELWAALRMDGLGQNVQGALVAWFDREVDRVWRQYQSGDHARALVPHGATREEERAIQREALQGDADTRLEQLTNDYRHADYGAGLAGAREIAGSLTESLDEGSQRFASLMMRVMEALGEVEQARSRWAEGDVGHVPSLASSTVPVPTVAHDDADVPTLAEVAEAYLSHRKTEKNTEVVPSVRTSLRPG